MEPMNSEHVVGLLLAATATAAAAAVSNVASTSIYTPLGNTDTDHA